MPNPRITAAILQSAVSRDKALGVLDARKERKPRKATAPKMLEASVSKACVDFLEAHGWRAIRMPRGKTNFAGRWVTIHEPGCPDFLMVRYRGASRSAATGELLWLEMKQANSREKCVCAIKKPRARCTFHDQEAWRVREQARGAVVLRIESLDQLVEMEVWK